MALKPRKITLTAHQQHALNRLATGARLKLPARSSTTGTSTHSRVVWIHTTTARALERRRLVTLAWTPAGYMEICLTERGWEYAR